MRIFGNISYKGSKYLGWQKQTNGLTIQNNVEDVLSKILNRQINIYGSGRTDAGVHAIGQTFHFDIVEEDLDLEKLRYSCNCLLPKDIHINSFAKVVDDFHARFSAKGKTYIYKMLIGENNPLLNDLYAIILQKMDISLFKKALNKFVGEHNFQDFSSKEEDDANFVRIINEINVKEEENTLIVSLTGNGFMRYMIRDIIGTAIAVAQGYENLSFIDEHLCEKTREIVHYKAPAEGLYLYEVKY